MARRSARFLTALILFSSLCACSGAVRVDNALIGRLRNRGLVPLSADNPYLAANLLVSKEMDKSEELRGFVQHRGAPAAIAVEKGTFSALLMKFYYPERDEYYNLEDVENTWIISGPYPVPAAELGRLAPFTRKSAVTPRLAREEIPMATPIAVPSVDPARDQAMLQPSPVEQPLAAHADNLKPLPSAAPVRPQGFQSPPLPQFVTPQPSPVSQLGPRSAAASEETEAIRRIIEASPKTMAELTPRGDLVHYVTYPGETLSVLSRWYTEDRENAGRLARINELKNPDKLALGDQIVIPAYLVKNKQRLTKEAIDGLRGLSFDR